MLHSTTVGQVLDLYISVKGKGREKKEFIDVDANGILDDKFYAKDTNRAILLTSKDSYSLAKKNGIDVEYGLLGENILIDINLYDLKVGDKLCIGDTELEITQNCTICNSLSKIDKRLPSVLSCDRGIFAKTVVDAKIKKGDKVILKSSKKGYTKWKNY